MAIREESDMNEVECGLFAIALIGRWLLG